MIIFPKNVSCSSRYILTLYLNYDRNNKLVANLASVSVRTVQRTVKKHSNWLNGYKEQKTT